MPDHILVPVDDSAPSRAALDYVVSRHSDDAIIALHVLNPADMASYGDMEGGMMGNIEAIHEQRRESGEGLLQEMREQADTRNTDFETELMIGQPARTILEYVDDNDVDHIVIGSHGRTGASRVLLGSVAENVVRRSPVPVTVIR